MPAIDCPLCSTANSQHIDNDQHRPYYACRHCDLRFVPATHHLSAHDEKAIYDYHENDPDDPGYRNFLSRLASPLTSRLPAGACGIDVGCGPGPALSKLLNEKGFACEVYDPFYFPAQSTLEQRYDFVTATEVVEHFCQPRAGFDLLFNLVKPKGWIGIMTKTIPADLMPPKPASAQPAHAAAARRFHSWHYTRDLTHVSFYADTTLQWIAEHYGAQVEILRSDVAIFRAA